MSSLPTVLVHLLKESNEREVDVTEDVFELINETLFQGTLYEVTLGLHVYCLPHKLRDLGFRCSCMSLQWQPLLVFLLVVIYRYLVLSL